MTEKDKSTVLLEHYLKKLKLPTMLREYAQVAASCQKDRSDYATFLLRLAERELLDRDKRAAERRIKDANFPVIKTIDAYDFKAQPSVNEHLVRELFRGEYIDKRENVLLIGNPRHRQDSPGIRPGLLSLRPGPKSPLPHRHRPGHTTCGMPGREKAPAVAQTASAHRLVAHR